MTGIQRPTEREDRSAIRRTVQVSLDVSTVDEALRIAEIAARAGVDWLEAGTG